MLSYSKQVVLTAALAVSIAGTAMAEPSTGRFALKQNISQQCKGPECISKIKFANSATHEFDITPAEEAQLLDDASVDINIAGSFYAIDLSDDPKFQNGDTSARVKQVEVINELTAKGKITVQATLKWKNGRMTVRFKHLLNITQVSDVSPTMEETQKAVEIRTLESTIRNTGGDVVSVTTPFITEVQVALNQKTSANGDTSMKVKQSLKSKGIAP